jgi:hypothetical protein
MHSNTINYLALIVALLLSCVSGYYSVIGLTAIFSSAFYPVLLMGASLELGKLVTASWLYNNWNIAPRFMKIYLTISVVILMAIGSMGVFGFLSRAHIEQTAKMSSGAQSNVDILQQQIDTENQFLNDINTQIKQIDDAIAGLNTAGQSTKALKAQKEQSKNREELVKKKTERVKVLSDLQQQIIKYKTEIKMLEVEVGPIRYIADLIYENADTDQHEKAVRIVIIILIIVFDPLAVCLLMAANHGINHRKKLLTYAAIHDNIDKRVLEIKGDV